MHTLQKNWIRVSKLFDIVVGCTNKLQFLMQNKLYASNAKVRNLIIIALM